MQPLSRAVHAYLVPWRELSWPVAWHETFGREAPLAAEIGFGNGAFLEELGRAHPERDHVGVELSWTSATHLFRRLEKGELGNVRAVLADARVALERLFPPASLDAVYVNHPCPWPKARHEDRRLLDAGFLRLLATRTRPGARLLVVTDHDEHATWIRGALEAQDGFVSRHATSEVDALPGRRPTKYERKALAAGARIHYFDWERSAGAGPPPPEAAPLPPATMLSLTLQGACRADALLEGFEPALHRELHEGVEVVVRLVGAYRGVTQRLWLVEAFVKEDALVQEFAVAVVPEEGDRVLVKPSALGRAHPTYGVKRAVWLVGRWLRERHAALQVVHENVGREVVAASADPPERETEAG